MTLREFSVEDSHVHFNIRNGAATVGPQPRHVAAIGSLFRELQNAGTTLVIATHRTDPFQNFTKKGSIVMDRGTITHQTHSVV